ncbi:hypothetical protein LCGC14_1074730 [marine sediment metagenome]|uniref:Uncharacterized protein n=1 Tax=marine sediment metagenome TaxID=412755 RepID=A0A0F9Q037_9ZZZZ
MSVQMAALLRGTPTQSTGVANGTATATVAAIAGVQHLVFGVEANYDVGVSAIKTITIKHGGVTWVTFRWDFTNGPFVPSEFPVALKAALNEAVTAELQASGAGGTTGYVTLYTATS